VRRRPRRATQATPCTWPAGSTSARASSPTTGARAAATPTGEAGPAATAAARTGKARAEAPVALPQLVLSLLFEAIVLLELPSVLGRLRHQDLAIADLDDLESQQHRPADKFSRREHFRVGPEGVVTL
jgi:hypothetical protein